MSPSTAASRVDAPAPPSLGEVDASCRTVSFFLLAKSSVWLVLGALFLLLASVRLHAPGMFSDTPWLTYGRMLPAGWNALVYGFLGQAGFAVGLWLLARASAQRLQASWLCLAGGVFWNLGLLAGVVGVLTGHSTGRELLEFPPAAMALLVVGAGLIGTSGWLTYAARTESRPYPSAWFVLLALLSIVWFGTAALMMLSGEGTRGMMQVLTQRWFAGGILRLWLGSLALATVLVALPLYVQRPLASRPLTLVAFWCLVAFTPWAVTEHGDPFPRWLVSAGLAGRTLGTIGLLAIGLNLWKTAEGAWSTLFSSNSGRLIGAAAIAYVAGGFLQFVTGLQGPSSVVRLTWLTSGLEWLAVAAAFLAFIAVIPELVERSSGRALSPALLTAHAWLSLAGLALIVVPLILAGVTHGGLLAGRSYAFLDALRTSLHWVRLSSLGFTVFFLGQLAFLAAWIGWMRSGCLARIAAVQAWLAPAAGKGVTARP